MFGGSEVQIQVDLDNALKKRLVAKSGACGACDECGKVRERIKL